MSKKLTEEQEDFVKDMVSDSLELEHVLAEYLKQLDANNGVFLSKESINEIGRYVTEDARKKLANILAGKYKKKFFDEEEPEES